MVEQNQEKFPEAPMLSEISLAINKVALQIESSRQILSDLEERRADLVKAYQLARYQAQLALWKSRGLSRCTKCFEVGLSGERIGKVATDLGFGLIPEEDATYILLHYTFSRPPLRHRGYTRSKHEAHCLCPACYDGIRGLCRLLKNYSMMDLSYSLVERINRQLANSDVDKDEYEKILDILKCDPKIIWHDLPIPEKAYEIGEEFR